MVLSAAGAAGPVPNPPAHGAGALALPALCFDNRFVADLPADPEARNFRRQVMGACYSKVDPTPVKAPRLIAYAPEVA
jgi:hypothetical protein